MHESRTGTVPCMNWPRWKWISVLAGTSVAGFALLSCSTLQRTVNVAPSVEGATFVGNKVCYDCHTNISRGFLSTAHARIHLENAVMKGQTGCESCHGPGSKHVAAGGGRGRFIVNPGKDPEACYTCHLQTHAEFRLPHHHPVTEGRMNCLSCHDPHGPDILKPAKLGLGMARLNETCAQCHREQAKQHVFQHEAMREGCTSCHVPHGSINAKLLTERDSNLCLKCHAQTRGSGGAIYIGTTPHTSYISRGACWSAGCHPAVHGSSVSPRLHY